ncbi:hypothetical protein ACQRIT_006728 [Beauveria bassiana]
MKVSTTSFLLASLYSSALAAPVGGDLSGALKSVTDTAGLGNVAPGSIVPENDLTKGLTGAVSQSDSIVGRDSPIGGDIVGDIVGDALQPVTGKDGLGNVAPGSIVPENDLTKGLTGAVSQSDSIVGRDSPIGGDIVGDIVGDVLQPVTGKDGLGNVVPGNAVPGNIDPVNDVTKGLTGAVGQPGNIVGRDGEQKASAVLDNYEFLATDAKAKAQPFAKPPADVNVGANLDTRNLDAKVKGVVGQLVDSDAHAKAHPFAQPPVDVNIDANVDAHNVDAKPTGAVDQLTDAVASGATLADNIAEPTGSVDSALEDATGPDNINSVFLSSLLLLLPILFLIDEERRLLQT